MKKIFFLTGTRAEYGLLKDLINLFCKSKKFQVNLIITGSHLSKKYGNTIKDIDTSRLNLFKIKLNLHEDSIDGNFKNQIKISKEIFKICKLKKPDFFVVLGDRFEIFSACSVVQFQNIPIFHIHGGEKTVGSLDDQLRHSITKMSHLHFVANKDFKKRVIQLGENPKNVFIVGGLGVDKISKTKLINKNYLYKKLNLKKGSKKVLITLHPNTVNQKETKEATDAICKLVRANKSIIFLITYPNFDFGNQYIIEKFLEIKKENKNVYIYKSLGDKNYLSLLKNIDLVLGNSSSSFTEAPFFKTPVINIGDRQTGRPISKNIINVKAKFQMLNNAFNKSLLKNYKNKLLNLKNYYGNPGASKKIFKIINNAKISKKILIKNFYDL